METLTLSVNTMKLKYPHARLAVYNQLLLGRTCAEAICAAAQEFGLRLTSEPVVLPGKMAEMNCEALVTARRIFSEQKPESLKQLSARLTSLLEQYQAENEKSARTVGASSSWITCRASNCSGSAPVVLDLVLQCLDEAGTSLPNSRSSL